MSSSVMQQKPTFNIVRPFLGVLTVQLNHAMSMTLQQFFNDVEGVEEEDPHMYKTVYAFTDALRDPVQFGAYVYKEGPSFVVHRSFKGVVLIEMNDDMRNILIDFVSEIEGGVEKIIWAFRLGLENPDGCQEARSRSRTNDFNKRRKSFSRSDYRSGYGTRSDYKQVIEYEEKHDEQPV